MNEKIPSKRRQLKVPLSSPSVRTKRRILRDANTMFEEAMDSYYLSDQEHSYKSER